MKIRRNHRQRGADDGGIHQFHEKGAGHNHRHQTGAPKIRPVQLHRRIAGGNWLFVRFRRPARFFGSLYVLDHAVLLLSGVTVFPSD